MAAVVKVKVMVAEVVEEDVVEVRVVVVEEEAALLTDGHDYRAITAENSGISHATVGHRAVDPRAKGRTNREEMVTTKDFLALMKLRFAAHPVETNQGNERYLMGPSSNGVRSVGRGEITFVLVIPPKQLILRCIIMMLWSRRMHWSRQMCRMEIYVEIVMRTMGSAMEPLHGYGWRDCSDGGVCSHSFQP